MGIYKLIQSIFCKELLVNLEKSEQTISNNNIKIKQLTSALNKAEKEKSMWQDKATKNINVSEIDLFCQSNYQQIPMLAYKDKRTINGNYISLFLNELITPNAFEVIKFKKGISESNSLSLAKNVGNKVAQHITWVSDEQTYGFEDYYSYPNEALALKNEDCEGHAFVVASMFPDIFGVAYGFKEEPKGNKFGHAYNTFIHNNSLYILDTVGNTAYTELYKENSNYTIHYIITENHTYKIKGGVSFGRITRI